MRRTGCFVRYLTALTRGVEETGDVARFAPLGYRPVRACAVDLFPGTANVETVCLLSKLQSKEHIEVDIHMDELDLTDAEKKARLDQKLTYDELSEKSGAVSYTHLDVYKRQDQR